jgi:tetratricopeptide (TPR) repeat protein
MRKYLIYAASLFAFIYSTGCSNSERPAHNTGVQGTQPDTSRQALLQVVRAAEAKLKTTQTIDAFNGNITITAYNNYANHFPNDTLSAAFLFNAGGIASSMGQYTQALGFYNNVCTKFPNSRLIPECLLVEGFIYDNNLNDTAKAHAKYSELINRFPNDSISTQARQAIKLLGKTPEEIGKEFEEKNKKTKKA